MTKWAPVMNMLSSSGLSKLQADQKYGQIYFWGKIQGASNDYYVAYGLREKDIDFPSKQYCGGADGDDHCSWILIP